MFNSNETIKVAHLQKLANQSLLNGALVIGITCNKISCYMRDSACRWLIIENAKIFGSYVKIF